MNFENRRYGGTARLPDHCHIQLPTIVYQCLATAFGLAATPKTDGVRSVQFGQHVRHFSAVNHHVRRQLKARLTLSYRKDG